ncbi:MAG: zinc transporter ZupT [Tissierellia bacterium]|nr:zinc transporter ZupT [Tissierellia bacterium]
MSNEILSLGLTTIVGLTMGLGSLLSFLVKRTNKHFLSLSLSFSAGIMIYTAFMAILPEGIHLLEDGLGEPGYYIALLAFFGGMFLTALVEKIVHKFGGHYHPHHGEGHHDHHDHQEEDHNHHTTNLGIMSAIAIAIHNLPEGLAIYTTGLKDIALAIPIAIGVILHNIPLSIAITMPLFYATGSRKKGFLFSLLVGLCQPLGAVIGHLLLANFLNETFNGILFSIVGGIMIFISLDELLPISRQDDDHHLGIYATILGMIIMALSMNIIHHHH